MKSPHCMGRIIYAIGSGDTFNALPRERSGHKQQCPQQAGIIALEKSLQPICRINLQRTYYRVLSRQYPVLLASLALLYQRKRPANITGRHFADRAKTDIYTAFLRGLPSGKLRLPLSAINR